MQENPSLGIELTSPNSYQAAKLSIDDFCTTQPPLMTEETIQQLMKLQGQCKIIEITFLQVNYIKGILLFIPLFLSIIGLFLLKYYKSLRVKVFYTTLQKNQLHTITHIFIKGTDKAEQIDKVQKKKKDGVRRYIFKFKELKYQIINFRHIPLGFNCKENIHKYMGKGFLQNGLSYYEAIVRSAEYGKNEHLVEIPNYFEYLFDVMTKPFFIFQYIVSLIYILENVAVFGILMIAFSFITTSINYVLLYFSFQKIKSIAEKTYDIRVFRDKQFIQVKNTHIVPGDLFEPEGEVPCDAILLKGELFANEVNLTGQNVPIAKFRLEDQHQMNEGKHWIYEGSTVLTKKPNTLAMVVNIGYGSCKGRIIRKILTRVSKQPDFFQKMIYFLLEVMIISIIVYFATVSLMYYLQIEHVMVVLRFFNFITYSFPAPFPIFFNLAYSFCIVRLNNKGILGTQSEKTVESSKLTTLCFDKTGTLTETIVQLNRIIQIKDAENVQEITDHIESNTLITKLFASCHSVEYINGQHYGDQIDLRMYLHTKSKMLTNSTIEALRRVEVNGQLLDILKINQYESKFQSMSVVVRDTKTHKLYVFSKGSPQLIHQYSQLKYSKYDELVKDLSLQGLRSIAISYKQISERQCSHIMISERQECLRGSIILGVVAFVNKLKSDTIETINTIRDSNIRVKIITGDNIFVGVQTAMEIGIAAAGQRVIVLQGKHKKAGQESMKAVVFVKNQGKITQQFIDFPGFKKWNSKQQIFAVDNAFIEQNLDIIPEDRIIIFARISPDNKALIVRKHKQQITAQFKKRGIWQQIFGPCKMKIGMVGDGANDLMAIKEADVGIGISNSDAVYSSSFTIQTLIQIDIIIRQAKNAERQIVEITQYYSIVSVLSIIFTIALTSDGSYFTSTHQILKSFLITLPLTLFIALSRPTEKGCSNTPVTNFMSLQNHLVYWGNLFILGGGIIGAYCYYIRSSDFIPNPQPAVTFANGWNGNCKSSTIIFLMSIIIYTILPSIISRSSPWKQRIWNNFLFTLLSLIDLILSIACYFMTSFLSSIDVQPIARTQAGIVFAIMIGTLLVSFIFNIIIQQKSIA